MLLSIESVLTVGKLKHFNTPCGCRRWCIRLPLGSEQLIICINLTAEVAVRPPYK